MAHSHCPPMDYTEATLKLGGGKNGAFSFSSHGLQPKVVSHDKVASNRKSTTNFIFIHYRQNSQWVDAPLKLGVAGMAHSQFFLPTMDRMQGPSPVAKWLIDERVQIGLPGCARSLMYRKTNSFRNKDVAL